MELAIIAVGSKSSYIDKTLKNTESRLNEITLKDIKAKEKHSSSLKIYLLWIIMFSEVYAWVAWEIIPVILFYVEYLICWCLSDLDKNMKKKGTQCLKVFTVSVFDFINIPTMFLATFCFLMFLTTYFSNWIIHGSIIWGEIRGSMRGRV